MKKTLMTFLIAFLSIFLSVNYAILQLNQLSYPLEETVTFKDDLRSDYRASISSEMPRVIAIGDSAIRELDAAAFSQALGQKTLVFSAPGTGSAYWYLFFRHQVLAAQYPPDIVLFFFRGVSLTEPGYLTSGSYFVRLEETAASTDADVYALAISQRGNAMVRLAGRYIPLFAFRSEIYRAWVAWARDWLPRLFLACDSGCVDAAFDQVFDEPHINALLWEDLLQELDRPLNEPQNLDFQANIESSLLPLILKDARRAGITPVFVRVQQRSQAAGESDSPEMTAYLQALQHYVLQNGGLYVDLVETPGLDAQMYRDEFHLNFADAAEVSMLIAQQIHRQLEFLPLR